jgi:hypothetical protein
MVRKHWPDDNWNLWDKTEWHVLSWYVKAQRFVRKHGWLPLATLAAWVAMLVFLPEIIRLIEFLFP